MQQRNCSKCKTCKCLDKVSESLYVLNEPEAIRLLVSLDTVNLNYRDRNLRTVLFRDYKNVETFRCLVELGLDPYHKDRFSNTLVLFLIQRLYEDSNVDYDVTFEIIKILAEEYKIDINHRSFADVPNIEDVLRNKGRYVPYKNVNCLPMQFALELKDKRIAYYLIENNVCLKEVYDVLKTLLNCELDNKRLQILIDKGVLANIESVLLDFVRRNRDFELCKFLIEKCESSYLPKILETALECKRLDVIDFLVKEYNLTINSFVLCKAFVENDMDFAKSLVNWNIKLDQDIVFYIHTEEQIHFIIENFEFNNVYPKTVYDIIYKQKKTKEEVYFLYNNYRNIWHNYKYFPRQNKEVVKLLYETLLKN